MARGRGRDDRLARERAARLRRTANAKRSMPVTEASSALAAVLEEAGLGALAVRARQLEFDENYSRAATPLVDLVAALARANRPDLIERVTAGEFDSTAADNAAWYATAAGRAEVHDFERLMAEHSELREAADQFADAVSRADPRTLARVAKEGVARVAEQATGGGWAVPVGDDDEPVDEAQVPPVLRGLLGQKGPDGQRLDTAEIIAAAQLAGRSGGRNFELGWLHDDVPTERRGWYAFAVYGEHQVGVSDLAGPNAAAAAFAARILDGGRCQHCRRLVTTNPQGGWAHDRTLVDGTVWTAAQQQQAGVCVWRRAGISWVRGCETAGEAAGE